MEMLVETFEQTETLADGKPPCDAESIALIESLGLGGQQRLIRGDEGKPKKLMPYRLMTADEQGVYRTICPRRVSLEEYADSAIPLRVLQVAAHAKDFFAGIEVWAAESTHIKDPVLVGCPTSETWRQERFILARWGAELEPFEKLVAKAAEVIRLKLQRALEDAMDEVEQQKRLLPTLSAQEIIVHWSETPALSGKIRQK